MHISLKTQLADYLIRGDRKLMLFLDSINAQRVKFSGKADLFSNLNTPADCDLWEQREEANDELQVTAAIRNSGL